MKSPPRPPAVRRRLIALLLGTGVLAVAGGVLLMVAADGHLLRLQLELLEPTPFASYRVPGLVLAFVVGGTQLAAGIGVLRHHPRGLWLSTVAGVTLAGWIAVQAMMLGALIWLQPLFFVVAIVELMLVGANLPRRQPAQKKRFGQR